jgi:hypothetical protein
MLVTARAASRTSLTCFSDRRESFAAELRVQLALAAGELLLALEDVHGDPDVARLVRHAALDGLADPPGRVGRELEAATPVELLDGADQAEDALLDQVRERQAVALVLLRDRDDEPEVRVDHPVLGLDVAALDTLRQLDLLRGGQQRIARHLVQEHLERVGGEQRDVAAGGRGVLLLGIGELDPAGLDQLVQALDLVVREVGLGDRALEGGAVQHALLLGVAEQGLEQLVLCSNRGDSGFLLCRIGRRLARKPSLRPAPHLTCFNGNGALAIPQEPSKPSLRNS